MKTILMALCLICNPILFGQVSVSYDTILMGSAFSFTAVSESSNQAWIAIDEGRKEVARLERMISSWDPKSETSEVNRQAGISPVKVSQELFDLIERSKVLSTITQGYFDISFAAMDGLWNFKGDQTELPDEQLRQDRVALVNHEWIELDHENRTVFLKAKGMKIGFGAIGKGFAAKQAKIKMLQSGAQSGVVNAGGDLTAWGERPGGGTWNVGIQDPEDKHNALMYVSASNSAVVTSGNYERFVDIDGVRYCHILNPKTGWPVVNLKSVTISCADAELADALSTTVYILGVEAGLDFINQLGGVECIIIDENNHVHYSSNVQASYEASR